MKNFTRLLLFIFILSGFVAHSQCTVQLTANPGTTVCEGGTVVLNADVTMTGTYYNFDFNSGTTPPGWSFVGAATFSTNPACAGPSLDGSAFYWSSTAATTPILTTSDLDVSAGGDITYDFRFRGNSSASPCETADQYNEGVSLEYSINGGSTWTVIVYHCSVPTGGPWAYIGGYAQTLATVPASTTPGNGNGSCGIYNNWANYTIPIPPAAHTANTRFRWRQPNSSGSCCDNWGLDNVNIAGLPNLQYDWSNGTSGVNLDSLSVVNVVSDTCFSLTVTDITTGQTCFDDVCVQVTPGPDLHLSVSNPHCAGDPVTFDASGSSASLTTFNWDFDGDGIVDGTTTSPIHTETAAFTTENMYNMILTASTAGGACNITLDTLIEIYPNPVVDVSALLPSICANNSNEFEALININNVAGQNSTLSNVQWDFNSDGIIDTSGVSLDVIEHIFTQAGGWPITAIATTNIGCEGSDFVMITVNPAPVIDAGPDFTICDGETINLQAAAADIYDWSPATALSSTDVQSPAANPSTTITYTLLASSTAGCAGTDQVTVTVNPTPIVNAGADQEVCEGTNVVLSGSGAINYSWDQGITNQTYFEPAVGQLTYTVVGTSAEGCTGTDQAIILVNALPNVSFSQDLTQGCTPLTVQFTNTTPNSVNCNWTFGNGSTSQDCGTIPVIFTQQGYFDAGLTVTDINGCVNSILAPDLIYAENPPVASFLSSTTNTSTVDTEVDFTNTTTGAIGYFWEFGDGETSFMENPTHTYPIEMSTPSITYPVVMIASSPIGCLDTAVTSIIVWQDLIFYIPNTFTPDNDEFNPTFQPVFYSGHDPFDFHLSMYNRWGELVFESHDATIGWDGTFGVNRAGELCQDGTYIWKIEFKTIRNDERKVYQGHVTLIR